MTAKLFLLQRISAAVLALAVAVHLATIVHAVRGAVGGRGGESMVVACIGAAKSADPR